MEENNSTKNLKETIQMAIELPKCRKCGCMKESLTTIKLELLKTKNDDFSELLKGIESSIEKIEPLEYT